MLQAQTTQNDAPTGSFFGGSDNATRVSHSKNAVKVGTLTASQLRERGWTKRMLERFLVKPDGYAQNPHVLTGRPMRLYRTDRVQAAEAHDDFTGCLVAAKVRSARFADLYKLKADALCLIADGIDIDILKLDRQTLTRNTHAEYGMFLREHDHCKNEVAYLMAHAKNSEWGLDAYYWHQGIRMARLKLRRRVLVKVMERYPHLGLAVMEISRDEAGEAAGI